MAWVRFTADFNWPALGRWHTAYKAGMRMNVPRACQAAALEAGKATSIKAPPPAHREALRSNPRWTPEQEG